MGPLHCGPVFFTLLPNPNLSIPLRSISWRGFQRSLDSLNRSYRRLVAAPTLELPLHVVHPAVQPFNRPRDLANVIAGDCCLWIGRSHGRGASLTSDVGTVRQAIPLVTQAESIAKLEVEASSIRIAPYGGGILCSCRSNAEEDGNQGHGSHRHSMAQGSGPVQCLSRTASLPGAIRQPEAASPSRQGSPLLLISDLILNEGFRTA